MIVDALGVAAGDVAVAEVLADDRAVLALDEGVVVGVSGSGLGELVDVEGFEQPPSVRRSSGIPFGASSVRRL